MLGKAGEGRFHGPCHRSTVGTPSRQQTRDKGGAAPIAVASESVCVCLYFRRGAESLMVEATGLPCAITT